MSRSNSPRIDWDRSLAHANAELAQLRLEKPEKYADVADFTLETFKAMQRAMAAEACRDYGHAWEDHKEGGIYCCMCGVFGRE